MKVRAHHGVCVLHFTGEGYDGPFVKNMKAVIRKLKQETAVSVVDGPDPICTHCPHNTEAGCVSAEKVGRYDQAVLELCGITAGTELTYGEFEGLIRSRIVDKGRLGNVCGDCEWQELCLAVERGER